jgi:ubiquitin carboxyl-terminal hydrolase L3
MSASPSHPLPILSTPPPPPHPAPPTPLFFPFPQLPLESNPEVMNAYARKLGLPDTYEYVDLLSTEDWGLAMVPRPVHAVLMLFPIKEASEKHRAEEAARIAKEGQVVHPQTYFCAQTIDNACGTIGILHSVANACSATGGPIPLAPTSWFSTFLSSTMGATPSARAAALEADDAVDDAHAEAVEGGQSAQVDDTYLHFACFMEKGGCLYELDGRKASPINHGPCTPDELLEKAAGVVKGFMARDPGELRFTMVALVTKPEEEDEEDGEEGTGGA